MKKEQKRRSLIKAITYRIAATIATFSIALTFTGNIELATTIGLLDAVVKFLLFYINERIWIRTNWGYQVDYSSTSVDYEHQEAFSKIQQHD